MSRSPYRLPPRTSLGVAAFGSMSTPTIGQVYRDEQDPTNPGWAGRYIDPAGTEHTTDLDAENALDAARELWAWVGDEPAKDQGLTITGPGLTYFRGPDDWRLA